MFKPFKLFKPVLFKAQLPIAALLMLSSCASPTPSSVGEASSSEPVSTASAEPSVTPTTSPSAEPEAQDQSLVISQTGIGNAQLGMTLAELKQTAGADTEFTVKSPFIVDFDAIAVSQAGEVQYYILYLAGEPLTDTGVIQGLFTDNPKFKTEAGVGPNSTIQDAEAVYGKATLSYNTDNESREYVRFENQPAPNISFGTGNAASEPAGVYNSPVSGYNETPVFNEGATIQSVLVVCLDENCTGAR